MFYVVKAKEIVLPKGVEAIDWLLLTNVPVINFEDAIERINWYKLRWKIEEYFRVALKFSFSDKRKIRKINCHNKHHCI